MAALSQFNFFILTNKFSGISQGEIYAKTGNKCQGETNIKIPPAYKKNDSNPVF